MIFFQVYLVFSGWTRATFKEKKFTKRNPLNANWVESCSLFYSFAQKKLRKSLWQQRSLLEPTGDELDPVIVWIKNKRNPFHLSVTGLWIEPGNGNLNLKISEKCAADPSSRVMAKKFHLLLEFESRSLKWCAHSIYIVHEESNVAKTLRVGVSCTTKLQKKLQKREQCRMYTVVIFECGILLSAMVVSEFQDWVEQSLYELQKESFMKRERASVLDLRSLGRRRIRMGGPRRQTCHKIQRKLSLWKMALRHQTHSWQWQMK